MASSCGRYSDIATGVLAPAANKVENTLARGLSLALDWLMRLVGLGNVPAKVRQHIEHARHWVDELVDKYLDKFIELAKKLALKGKQAVTSTVETVKDWLGFREKFTLPNQEKHTLFFREDGEFMLASDPTPYLKFLLQFEQSNPVAPGQQLRQQSELLQWVKDTKQLRADRQLLEQQQSSQQDQQNGKTAPELRLKLHQNEYAINQLMKKIARATVILMHRTDTGQVDDNSPILYSGLSAGGFGKGVLMEYLTRADTRGGSGTGDIPAGLGGDHYQALVKRRTRGGSRSYYRMGHLINAEYGGPGNEWKNLVPLSPSGNSLQLHRLEDKLHDKRNAAISSANTSAASSVRYAFFYSVVPQYAHPFRQDLHALALREASDESQQSQPDSDLIKHWTDVTAIIHAEQFVPRSLVCVVQEINPKTRKPNGGLVINTVVDNRIDQSGLQDYGTPSKKRNSLPKAKEATLIYVNRRPSAFDFQSPFNLGLTEHMAKLLVREISKAPLSSIRDLESFVKSHSSAADLNTNLKGIRTANAADRLRYGI